MPDEFQGQPMILILRGVVQHVQRTIVCGDYGVQAAIVINVADRKAASHPRFLENVSGLR